MRLRNILLISLMILSALTAWAVPTPVHESAAIADSETAGFVNPAALSFGTGNGFGYIQSYDADGIGEDFSLFLHSKGFGYAYSQEAGVQRHNFILSAPLFRNFYFGAALNSETFAENDLDWDFGLLYRPADYISIGGKAALPADGDPTYLAAVAMRPFFFSKPNTHRLSLFADLPVDKNGMDLPKIGIHFEPVEGIETRFGYDLETEGMGISLSMAFAGLRTGSYIRTDSSAEFQDGAAYMQLSPFPFTPPVSKAKDVYLDYDFGPQVVESGQTFKTGPFYLVMDQNSLLGTLDELKRIEETDYIDGLVFRNHHTAMNFSSMLELKNALQRIKEQGKKIVFYNDYMTTLEYLLAASTADEIYLHPEGSIYLQGFYASSPYFKDFFEKHGIEFVNIHREEYKSAYNFLSESSMPEAEREALDYMLRGLEAEARRLIEAGRAGKLKGGAEDLIADGPYFLADAALEAGLVDGLVQRDELLEASGLLSEDTQIKKRLPTHFVRKDWSAPAADKVAFIHAVGAIRPGEGVPGSSIGAETVAASIKAAREDGEIKAILLRVSSGGGSALASDIIAREVELCLQGPDAKPLVVSMAGAAASGGYYISAPAEHIVASPVAITGSIGVIALLPNIAGLLEEQQIAWDVVRTGPRSDFGALYRRPSEDEQERMSAYVDQMYERFIEVVSNGRNMPASEIREIAGGRIWTGAQAAERGLVDSLGGYDEAFDVIAEKAGLTGEIELIDYSFADTWGVFSIGRIPGMESLAPLFDNMNAKNRSPLLTVMPSELSHLYSYFRPAFEGSSELTYMVMPYSIKDVTSD